MAISKSSRSNYDGTRPSHTMLEAPSGQAREAPRTQGAIQETSRRLIEVSIL